MSFVSHLATLEGSPRGLPFLVCLNDTVRRSARPATDSPGSLITNTSEIAPDVVLQGTPSITYNGLTTFVPPPARSVAIEQVRRTK